VGPRVDVLCRVAGTRALTLRALRHRLPEPVRALWFLFRRHARAFLDRPAESAHLALLKPFLWAKVARGRSRYRIVAPSDARAARRSDTVFVFGSGYSLNDVTAETWAHFAEHDTFGFSGFVFQRWIRTDFHLIRGWDYGGPGSSRRWFVSHRAYADEIRVNAHYANTIFIVQDEYSAVAGRTIVGYRLLHEGASVLPYRTALKTRALPSEAFAEGLCHANGTLSDVVNAAYLFGWRHIVLVGVDLYDSRYFWGPPDATLVFDDRGRMVPSERAIRGHAWNERHNTAANGVVELMRTWREWLAVRGVQLSVHDRRSLLANVLPLYAGAARQTSAVIR